MATNSKIEPTSVWDAGAMGCGELIVLLRERILALAQPQVLHVTARDPGAPEDTRTSPIGELAIHAPSTW